MKLLLCFAILAALACSHFSLAAENEASVPPPVASEYLDDQPSQGSTNSSQLEKGVQKSNLYCSSYSTCRASMGIFSSCNSNSRCVCDMGYETEWLGVTCQKKTCSSSVDCMGKFGTFSHCTLSTCYCDSGYSYDLNLERCSSDSGYYYYYSGSRTNYGLAVGLPITIVGFILIIVAIILVRRRRMREEAARLAAMRQRVAMQPAAQVVISHQQQPPHPQQPIYYPPQNPPPFNPTFTGYQPAQPAPPQYFQQQQQPPAPGVHPSVASGSTGGHYPNLSQQGHYKS